MNMNLQENFIVNSSDIRALVARSHRVAVLGIKTEAQADQPAFYVPQYLADVGFEVIPVPVYYPEVTEILGRPVYRRPLDISRKISLVGTFPRSHHTGGHLAAIF